MPRIPEDGEPGGAPREGLFEKALLKELDKADFGLGRGPGGSPVRDEAAESEAAAERLRREQEAETARQTALAERRERLFFQHGVSSRARLAAEEALRAARDGAGSGGASLGARLEGELDARFARMMAEVSATLGRAPDPAALELAETVTGAQRASALRTGAALEAEARLQATEARLGQEVEVLEALAFRFPGSLEAQMGGVDRLQAIARVMELPEAKVAAFGDDAVRRVTLAALRGQVGENPQAALKTLAQGDFRLLGVTDAEVAELKAAAEARQDDRARQAARAERVGAARALSDLELEVVQGRAGPVEVAAAHRAGRITDGQREALDQQAAQVRARAVARDEKVTRVAEALAGQGAAGKAEDESWRAAVDAYYEDVMARRRDRVPAVTRGDAAETASDLEPLAAAAEAAATEARAAETARYGLARFVAKTGVLPKKLALRLAAGSLAERPSVETAKLVLDIDRAAPGLLDREARNGGPLTAERLAFSRAFAQGLEAGLDIETSRDYAKVQLAQATGDGGEDDQDGAAGTNANAAPTGDTIRDTEVQADKGDAAEATGTEDAIVDADRPAPVAAEIVVGKELEDADGMRKRAARDSSTVRRTTTDGEAIGESSVEASEEGQPAEESQLAQTVAGGPDDPFRPYQNLPKRGSLGVREMPLPPKIKGVLVVDDVKRIANLPAVVSRIERDEERHFRYILGDDGRQVKMRLFLAKGGIVAAPVASFGFPLGFDTFERFLKFKATAIRGIADVAGPNAKLALRGSAVTGRRYVRRPDGTKGLIGEYFDAKRKSDYDLAIISPELMQEARVMIGLRLDERMTTKLSERELVELGLLSTIRRLEAMTGRKRLTFRIYESEEAMKSLGTMMVIE